MPPLAERPKSSRKHVSSAPRFSGGKKSANAKFQKVIYNDKVVHENVECEGPTRSAMNLPESPTGPIMIQGDHGAVQFRKIAWRPLS